MYGKRHAACIGARGGRSGPTSRAYFVEVGRSRRAYLAIGGLIVSALALLFAFARVVHTDGGWRLRPITGWAELRAALLSANPGWLAGFVFFNLATLFPRALQLSALARRRDDRAPSFAAAWHAVALGFLAQNLLPARLGEAARVVGLVRAGNVPPAGAVAACVLGRVLDLIALVLVVCVPSLLFGLDAMGRLRTISLAGTALAGAAIAALVVLYRRRANLSRRVGRLGPRAGRVIGDFAEGLSAFGSWSRLAVAALASLAAPLTVVLAYGSALRAFGLGDLPPGSTLLLVATLLLAIAIPAAPSSVGVYHAAVSWLLRALGAGAAQAVAFAIVTHALGVVTFVLVGAASMVRLGAGPLFGHGPPPQQSAPLRAI
jgi:uncharacterized protein (TIRG00374 family)